VTRRAAIGLSLAAVAAGAGGVALAAGGGSAPDRSRTATPAGAGNAVAGSSAENPVLARARVKGGGRAYREARAAGAKIDLTPDGRSFYVMAPAAARGGRAIVTFHGYKSTAFDGFSQFRTEAKRAGYTLISVNWRLGPASKDSYSPTQMYSQARILLRRAGVAPGKALVHGYSSAAGRVYAVTALDRRASKFFALSIGDAGGARTDLPLYREVFGGGWGPKPLAGSHWVLFCGGRDPMPQVTGCPAMRRTQGLIRQRGGVIESLIVDPSQSHGGFHYVPAHQRAALAIFARLTR
jgi:hypothetical protein